MLKQNRFVDLTIGNDVIVPCELNLTQYTKNYNNTISLNQNNIWYTLHEEVVDSFWHQCLRRQQQHKSPQLTVTLKPSAVATQLPAATIVT